ncbi:MAG: chromate transporter [Rikenellaceae bacterium]
MKEKASAWELFTSFMKIGIFTFGGGYAMIALIQKEIVEKRGWVKKDDFLELLTIAQTAPGPLALNSSVFVGYRVMGLKGALLAVIGVVLPSFLIILLVAMFFSRIKDNDYVEAAFKGMRPAVVALIVAPVFSLARNLNPAQMAVAVVTVVAVWYFGFSPIYCIIVGAVGGIAWMKTNIKLFDKKK